MGENKKMRYAVDRTEDNGIAVLEREDGRIVEIALASLPAGIKTGDRLELTDGAFVRIDAEPERRRIARKYRKIFGGKKRGD